MSTTQFLLAIAAAFCLYGFVFCLAFAIGSQEQNNEPILIRLSIAQPGDYQLKVDRRTGEESMTRIR